MTAFSIANIVGQIFDEAGSGTDGLPDEHCAEAAASGDPQAFSELVRRYHARIFRYLVRMVGCREEARDLTQDTFLSAYRMLPRWERRAPFRTWLFRIASNAAIDVLRRRRIHDPGSISDIAEPLANGPDVEQLVHSEQRYAFFERALERVPSIYRQPLLLRELEGMSYGEIASLLDVAEGTVKSRIARARAQLAMLFESNGYA